jgi:hypothetical protein
MQIIIFLTFILATWRVAHLLTYEDGPWATVDTLRYWMGVRFDPLPPYEDRQGTNVWSKAIICVWCNSVWVGLSYTILYMIWQPLWLIALPFALSAGAIILEKYLGVKV